MRYTRKPVEVFAEIFLPDGKDGKGTSPKELSHQFRQDGVVYGSIPVKGGYITIKEGDYLITEEDGKKYVCAECDFDKNFEAVG